MKDRVRGVQPSIQPTTVSTQNQSQQNLEAQHLRKQTPTPSSVPFSQESNSAPAQTNQSTSEFQKLRGQSTTPSNQQPSNVPPIEVTSSSITTTILEIVNASVCPLFTQNPSSKKLIGLAIDRFIIKFIFIYYSIYSIYFKILILIFLFVEHSEIYFYQLLRDQLKLHVSQLEK